MIKEEMETRDDSGFTLRFKDPSKKSDMQKLGDNMSDGIEELYTVRDLIDIKEKLDSTEKIKMHDNQELITRSPVKDRQVKSEVDVKNIIGGDPEGQVYRRLTTMGINYLQMYGKRQRWMIVGCRLMQLNVRIIMRHGTYMLFLQIKEKSWLEITSLL